MNSSLSQLITTIVSYVTEHGGYLTKTKLLKLIYLFDVEYYRVHRRTFTELQWKYFHLGPWTREFDPVLGDLVHHGTLLEVASSKPDYDTKFYRPAEHGDIGKLFDKYSDQAILRSVLDTWGESSTGEILDHVYFRTEPMEHGVRNEPLDFTRISEQVLPKYSKRPSAKSTKDINRARRTLDEHLAKIETTRTTTFAFTPPRHDAEYLKAMEKLDDVD
jgi:hypothetical protein